jgi:hypothetical protein
MRNSRQTYAYQLHERQTYASMPQIEDRRMDADDPIAFCGGRRLDFSAKFILLVALPLAMP